MDISGGDLGKYALKSLQRNQKNWLLYRIYIQTYNAGSSNTTNTLELNILLVFNASCGFVS